MQRIYAHQPNLDDRDREKDYDTFGKDKPKVVPESEANLISSRTDELFDERCHMPAIDIDLPCRLVESRTPGHFHLYIDHPITWRNYQNVLTAMSRAGIVERGFTDASIARGASFLRKTEGLDNPDVEAKDPFFSLDLF